ncbi:MAG: hypothetical protein IT184_00600 [Acidobacteria bacterium]|nr:hypothetical protein [Acidobacteriota bacterium]
MATVAPTRVRIGSDVKTLGEWPGGIELEGRLRLRPGREVDVVDTGPDAPASPRRAVVWSWTVVAVGRNGPLFRGICHWT